MPQLALERVEQYLRSYIEQYRNAYRQLTERPPHGAGYPARPQSSTYLDDSPVEFLLGTTGWLVIDHAGAPRNESWHIAGGPAMMIDYDPTVVPDDIRNQLKASDLLGKNIGIYRIVSQRKLPIEVWTGNLPAPIEIRVAQCSGKKVTIKRYDTTLEDLLSRLTFGVFGTVDVNLGDQQSPFWMTRKVRGIGFTTADRVYKRFPRYIEIGRHLEEAAWDPRSVAARVALDLRWDYANSIGTEGGSLTLLGPADPPLEKTLVALADSIDRLSALLDEAIDSEDVYHDFLREHPILLDVYGSVISKPRFNYDPEDSPIGKLYVEPDFIVSYPDGTYRLIELERPGKHLDTARGEPRAHLTQSAFQIGEWKDYIAHNPSSLRDRFPGLVASSYRTTIILGRDTSLKGDREPQRYVALARQNLAVDEILTYDMLLERARTALVQLSALTVGQDPARPAGEGRELDRN